MSIVENFLTGVNRFGHGLTVGIKASFGFTSRESGVFMKKISPKGLEKFSCLLRFPENIRELMGHADVKTTEIYTHVMEKDISAALSPLDQLS
jgi:hypothetical protein